MLSCENNTHQTVHKRNKALEIKDYNVMINGRNFFDQPVKIGIKHENLREIVIVQGDDHTAGCLLDYPYFRDNFKLIAIDLNKQQVLDADPKTIQQINFFWNLDQAESTWIVFI